MLDHLPTGCVALTATGEILFWNAVLEAWTGCPRDRVRGRCLYDVFPRLQQGRYRSRIEQTLLLGAPAVLSALLTPALFARPGDGDRRRFEQVTITRLLRRLGAADAVLITICDVTKQFERGERFRGQKRRANAEAELRRAQSEELKIAMAAAESATRTKSLFLASMSHELRTPMNGVLGMADILLHSDLTAWQRENVQVLQASASSLLTVLNDILDFSKIEADKLEIESIAFDPRGVVEESVILVAELAHAKQLECTAIVEPSVPLRVMGDPTRLRQVLLNLLSNAIKFTNTGEVVVTLRVVDGASGARLCCEVRDTGGGMSGPTCQRLFEPFTQAAASTSRHHGGTGLGLSICRRLLRLMGGDILVHSELGRGSVFRFELPAHAAVDDGSDPRSAGLQQAVRAGICLVHEASAAALQAQIASLGGVAVVLRPQELSTDNRQGLTHIILDAVSAASAELRASPPPPGIARVLVARPSSSRGVPPPGFRAVIPMPCRASSLEAALSPALPRVVVAAPLEAVALGMHVLVAEDDRTNQLVIRAMLARFGCEVEIVANGLAAVEAATSSTYDLVLMDMQMPGMGGCEASMTLRREGYAGPIVALTASVLAEEQSACLASGMNEVLTKPVDGSLLHATLRRFQEQRNVA